MSKPIPVNLRILDKDYVVACPEEERDILLESANYLTQKAHDVKKGGKVVSNERIAVLSALNIIYEYFQYKQQQSAIPDDFAEHIGHLQEKIELALHSIKQ